MISKFKKKLAIKLFGSVIDEMMAEGIKPLTKKVESFIGPIKILVQSLSNQKGIILYKWQGRYKAFMVSDVFANKFRKDPNVLKSLDCESLKDVFIKSDVNDEDIAIEVMRNGEIEVADGVPDEVVEMFKNALNWSKDD